MKATTRGNARTTVTETPWCHCCATSTHMLTLILTVTPTLLLTLTPMRPGRGATVEGWPALDTTLVTRREHARPFRGPGPGLETPWFQFNSIHSYSAAAPRADAVPAARRCDPMTSECHAAHVTLT